MSSLFDVPQQLVMILSLVSAGAGEPSHMLAVSALRDAASTASTVQAIKFSEQRWLEAVRLGAGGDELRPLAGRVFRTSGGRYYVPVESERRAILKLREDRATASDLSLGLARINARALDTALGRSPTAVELYLAHVLGHDTALAFIGVAERAPDSGLDAVMPNVAAEYPELRGPAAATMVRLGGLFSKRPSGGDVAKWFRRPSERFAENDEGAGALVEQIATTASEVRSSLRFSTAPAEAVWPSAWRVEVVATP